MNEIKIQSNFLSAEECDWFIRFFQRNKTRVEREDEGPKAFKVIDLYDHHMSYEVKYLLGLLTRFCPILNSFVEYFQVVNRTEGNELPVHIDFEDMAYSSVLYLNEGYEGGETFVGLGSEQTLVKPERGKIVGFLGSELSHGILPITKGVRYVVTCWWKTPDWVPENTSAALSRTNQRLARPMFLSEKQNPDFPYAD